MAYEIKLLGEVTGKTDPLNDGAFYLYGDNENSNRVRGIVLSPVYDGETEPKEWEVYQFNVERCTHEENEDGDWILSDNFRRPELPVWFSDVIDHTAQANKIDVDDLIWFLQSCDAKKRANVYLMIAKVTSWGHFDQYPIRFRLASEVIEFLEGLAD